MQLPINWWDFMKTKMNSEKTIKNKNTEAYPFSGATPKTMVSEVAFSVKLMSGYVLHLCIIIIIKKASFRKIQKYMQIPIIFTNFQGNLFYS